jgi:general secretion pathway protein H
MKTPRKDRSRGFTLLEVLVVIVIIGISLSMVGVGAGTLMRSELKSSCNKIISAARYAYNRAVIHGTTVRVSFQLPGETFSMEEAHGQITLARPDDELRFESAEEEGGEHAADVDPWAAAKSRLQDTFKVTLGASAFAPIGGGAASGEGEGEDEGAGQGRGSGSRFANMQLGRGIRIVKLIVPHEPVPRESGTGAVYFFPNGQTEHAVIQMAQRDGRIYSVEIHPLTGRGRVHTEPYEPELLLGDPEDREHSEVDGP